MYSKLVFVLLNYLWIIVTSSATNCPPYWKDNEGSCYLFSQYQLTFHDAENYCQRHGGYLVQLETSAENDYIKQEARNHNDNYWWIGLTDEDFEGIWVWYGTSEELHYSDWATGQPDNAHDEDCVELYNGHYGWHWFDLPCTAQRKPICEKSYGNTDIIG